MRKVLSVLCLWLFAAPTGLMAQRNDKWRIIGPGGGGAQFLPTVSPHDPNRVLVSCDMTGSYITHDGGASWRMFNLRGRVRFFVFDPVDPHVIYAQSFGLFRSSDGGKTWSLLHPNPATITGIGYQDDHARALSRNSPSPGSRLSPWRSIHPTPPTFMQRSSSASGVTLRLSRDTGATWSELSNLAGGARQILHRPGIGRRRTAPSTSSAQTRSAPAKRASGAPARQPPHHSRASQRGSRRVVASFTPGLLPAASNARRMAAQPGAPPLATSRPADIKPSPPLRARRTSPTFPTPVCAPARNSTSASPERLTAAKPGTLSGGNRPRKSPQVDDGWLSARFGPGWGGGPLDLGVSPSNPDICYGTDYGRTLRTTDAGKTWRAAYTRKTPEGTFRSTGLDVTTNYGVHWDPFDSRRMFISYTDIGLFRSDDGGASWAEPLPAGIPREWRNTTYWLEFDPQVRGRMWAAMSGTHDLPRPKMWRSASPASYRGGVLRSDDGGVNWTPLTNGLPQTAVTHILLDPKSPASSRIIYAAGFGTGVYKSVDGGATWTLKNKGLPEKEPFAWRLVLAPDRTLYVIIARRSENGTFGNAEDGGLYRSTDGAENWQQVTLPEGLNGPNGLAVDPRDPKRLYLAAWGRRASPTAVMGGIWLSTDAGRTWSPVLDRDQHIYDVTIDPRNPRTLYACGFESSAWRSTDRGKTWQRIPGYNFKWGHRVIPDPADRAMIYITTYGGSVWHGPAKGDPNAAEDIITPQAAYRSR